DANQDHNGNGIPDLVEYAALQPAAASFPQSEMTVVSRPGTRVTVNFTKRFSGPVSVLLGGSALPGLDYTIAGFDPSSMTARLSAQGTAATFPITLIDPRAIGPDRYLLLSLLEPPTNAVSRYRVTTNNPTLRIRITDADRGVYAGTLSFTNN